MFTPVRCRRVSAVLVLALLFGVGCLSGPSPDKVVRDFFDAMIKGDFVTAAKLAGVADIQTDVLKTPKDQQGEQIVKSILARVTYEIGGKKINGNKAEVSVKVTSPDLLRITGQVMTELLPVAFAMAFSQEQSSQNTEALFEQYFENAIKDPNAPMVTSDITVQLERKNGSWVIKPDDALLNAITGNLAKAFSELNATK